MSFRERVLAGEDLLLDGGMGSALLSRGLAHGSPPELWNLERGEIISAIHRAYVVAGSDAVQTNTFGANPVRLAAFGLDARCKEINRAGVAHARAANPRFVIGDVGPTGEYLPPVGPGDLAKWRAAFERQGEALAAAGVDALHVETMSDLREALVALEALSSVAPGVPVMVSMTFDRKKRGFFTVMGDPLAESLGTLAERGAFAVGANCSIASGAMRELMDEAVEAVSVPLVAQPNAGTPELAPDGTTRYAQDPEEFANDMAALVVRPGAGVFNSGRGNPGGSRRRDAGSLRESRSATERGTLAPVEAAGSNVGPAGLAKSGYTADAKGLPSTQMGRGVAIVGGCCGTDHRFIAALAERLRETLR